MTITAGTVPVQKRPTASEAIRRGFDNVIANWQLLAIRVGESLLFGMIAVAAVLVVVVPIAVSAGLSQFDARDAAGRAEVVLGIIAEHWMVIVWSLLIGLALLLIFSLLHSFVIAGTARILVDGEHAAGAHPASRVAFQAFHVDRWVEGGRESWWAVFWIYNLVYGGASVVLLAPALLILVAMVVLRGSIAAIVAGCLGLVLLGFLTLILVMLSGIWCQKAIVVCVGRRLAGREALRVAWSELRRDRARHLTVGFVILVITIGGVGVIGMISVLVSAPGAAVPAFAMLFLPVRLLASVVQGIYGAAAGNLGMAAFAAISETR